MTANSSNSEIGEYRLKPDLQLVATTLSAMKEFLQARGLRSNGWSELELAAAEALNNAIEHGCAGHPETEVICRLRWTDETIESKSPTLATINRRAVTQVCRMLR